MAMFNPEILKKSGPYQAQEGCLSLAGIAAGATRWRTIKVRCQNQQFQERVQDLHRLDRPDHPARDRPLRRHPHLKGASPCSPTEWPSRHRRRPRHRPGHWGGVPPGRGPCVHHRPAAQRSTLWATWGPRPTWRILPGKSFADYGRVDYLVHNARP